MDDQGGCRQLIRRDDDIFEPVGVTKSKAQCRVNEATGVGGETAGSGQPGCHFTQGAHDDVDEETDHGVGDEDRGRSSFCECRTSADNQTGTLNMLAGSMD